MAYKDMVLVPQQIKVVADDFSNILMRGHPLSSFFRDEQGMVGKHLSSLLDLIWAQMDFSATLA
jgi:hypothetical protein